MTATRFARICNALAVLLIAAATASCTPGTKYSLYNNTDSTIAVRIAQQTYSIASRVEAELENWYAGPVIVETSTGKWSYSVTFPAFHALAVNGAYNEKASSFSKAEFAARRITIQLNSDGRVFVVPSGTTVPVSPAVEQPDGFPLLPSAAAARPNNALLTDAYPSALRASSGAAKRER
jgi:hypothetical protein